MSDYNFNPSVTQDLAKGFTMGAGIRYTEEQWFGIQAELLLTRRGWCDRYDAYPELSFQRNLLYVELPVLAHIYFECGKKSEVIVDLGPKFGTYLSSSVESNLPEDFGQGSYTQYRYLHHVLPVENKFDYGIQAGLGYEFKINRQLSFQLQGRYYFGLGDMFSNTKADPFENSSNHQIQIVASLWWKRWIKGKRVMIGKSEE